MSYLFLNKLRLR